jgi:hypothetical protein
MTRKTEGDGNQEWNELFEWIRLILQSVSYKELYLSAGLPPEDFKTLSHYMRPSAISKRPPLSNAGAEFLRAMSKLKKNMDEISQGGNHADIVQLLQLAYLEDPDKRTRRQQMDEFIELVKMMTTFGFGVSEVDVQVIETSSEPAPRKFNLLTFISLPEQPLEDEVIADWKDAVRLQAAETLGDAEIQDARLHIFQPEREIMGSLKGADPVRRPDIASGTVGFVTILQNQVCDFTCRHVLLTDKEALKFCDGNPP